jgi:hypothetical protein
VVVERQGHLAAQVQQVMEATLFWLLLHQPAVAEAEMQPMQIVAVLEGEVRTKEQAVLELLTKVMLVALVALHFLTMPHQAVVVLAQ